MADVDIVERGDELDSIIGSLTELRLCSSDDSSPAAKSAEDWAELLVGEMMKASDIYEAKGVAVAVVKGLENNWSVRARSLGEENALLKRAVLIQHRREKELEVGNKRQALEIHRLQHKLTDLERTNFTLRTHLNKALPQFCPFSASCRDYH